MKDYYDIDGDGGSDVLQQVADLKAQIEENLGGVRHMVAIGSEKGGVGKSTLTMRIASVLRSQRAHGTGAPLRARHGDQGRRVLLQ